MSIDLEDRKKLLQYVLKETSFTSGHHEAKKDFRDFLDKMKLKYNYYVCISPKVTFYYVNCKSEQQKIILYLIEISEGVNGCEHEMIELSWEMNKEVNTPDIASKRYKFCYKCGYHTAYFSDVCNESLSNKILKFINKIKKRF